mmetsp:Transcript_7939/g.25247  ORF Transcript_7939/g.25247 Transcript_7939/m.25247 type:complete len:337 (+) Transcript_7939:78-1088(+)
MENRVGGKFTLRGRIGSGSFGEVRLGTNVLTGEEVAIKLEPILSKSPRLLFEAKVYRVLAGGIGIPSIHWYGVEGGYSVLVMDLLGPTLEDLRSYCRGKFNLKTVLMLMDQMMCRVEFVHAKGLLHRDIKPDNFLIGLGMKANMVHLVDFGLAKPYRDFTTQEHIPYREGKTLVGTANFCSINAHLGLEQGRRDDLEAVGYVMMYFLRGNLPWHGLKDYSKRGLYQRIMDKKMSTPTEILCKRFPTEFATYFKYCRDLGFEETPDYAYARQLLKDLFIREGYSYDCVFDWTSLHCNEGTEPTDPSTAASSHHENQFSSGGGGDHSKLLGHAGTVSA